MGGAIFVRALQLQHDLVGTITFEPFVGNGRPHCRMQFRKQGRHLLDRLLLLFLKDRYQGIDVLATPRPKRVIGTFRFLREATNRKQKPGSRVLRSTKRKANWVELRRQKIRFAKDATRDESEGWRHHASRIAVAAAQGITQRALFPNWTEPAICL